MDLFTRVFIVWFTLCAFLTLSACGGNEDAVETSAITPSIDGESNQNDTNETPDKADVTSTRTFGVNRSGEATYYRATGKGNCSFDASDNLMVVAINTADYATATLCGAYIAVTGRDGMVVVRVVDRCPGCKQGGLDLSRQAFERIAKPAEGRVPVSWQVVEGPVSGPIEYHYMEGTTRYWTAIQVRNHRWPVAKLEIMPMGTTEWLPVERRVYNYFVLPRPISAGALRVRVTAVTGEALQDVLPEPTSGLLVQGHAQFD